MMPELIFMYGYTASGKTTYAQQLIKDNPDKQYKYLSADEVRAKLYGSQDHFGNAVDIYEILLKRMLGYLKSGQNVIYDACNLYKQFRMDYLGPIETIGIPCYKKIIRINTIKQTCLANHEKRNRNFDITNIMHYFDINEPPDMSEGWDYILDVKDHALPNAKTLYIASPFFEPINRAYAIQICEHYRNLGHSVILPLEHKFENAYNMPNDEWGKAVFDYDIKAINAADFVICLSYGRNSTAGTNWEAGYAYGIGKPVLVVEMPGVNLMSLMLMNGSHAVLNGPAKLFQYDLDKAEKIIDTEMEQK